MAAGEIEVLRGRARTGDVVALTELGKRLLTGDGVRAVPAEAAAYLSEAAERGGAEANALVARFAGWGVLRPRNLAAALDSLQRAAYLGWLPSQRELQCLARDSGSDWGALRRRVDVAQWTRAPDATVLSDSPRINAIEGFATAAESNWLIGLRRTRHAPRTGLPARCAGTRRGGVPHQYRIRFHLLERRPRAWPDAGSHRGLHRRGHAVLRGDEAAPIRARATVRPSCGFQEPTTPALARELELTGSAS